jgi:hypothetical protein
MDNDTQRLVAAINRNAEVTALVAGLQGMQCTRGCGRFATKIDMVAAFRVCDTCATYEEEELKRQKETAPDGVWRDNYHWEELASAKRARRLESILTGEADQCVNYNY